MARPAAGSDGLAISQFRPGQRRQEADGQPDARFPRKYAQSVGQPRLGAHPCYRRGIRPVIEQHRLNRNAIRHRADRRQQRTLDRQQAGAVAGGAFGEQNQSPAIGQRPAQLLDLPGDPQPVVPGNEDRVVHFAQCAQQAAGGEPVMRHEGRTRGAGDGRYVEPADVIGEQEFAALHAGAVHHHVQAGDPSETAEKAARPGVRAPGQPPQPEQWYTGQQPAQHQRQAAGNAQPAGQRNGRRQRSFSGHFLLVGCALRSSFTPYSSMRWSTRRKPSRSAICRCKASSSGSTNSMTLPLSTSMMWS